MIQNHTALGLRGQLIVALDVSSAVAAQRIVYAVGDSAHYFKVGKQLFTAEGPAVVRDLVASGKRVFLDLKFHDIPNTVAAAVREAAALGANMLTVHASGGSKMLKAAVEAAASSGAAKTNLLVVAVTVLTSMDDHDLGEIGVSQAAARTAIAPSPDGNQPSHSSAPQSQSLVQTQVLRLAELALQAGCGGIVASAQEAALVRASLGARYGGGGENDFGHEYGSGFAIVTPGIRPAGSDAADQARIVTPSQALAAGATHLVVGRPITAAQDPRAAARAIVAEMALSS